MSAIAEAQEEEFDEEENDTTFLLASKEEAREHLYSLMESQVVSDMIRDHLAKINLVRGFVLTLVLRKRFKRKVRAIPKMQNFFRICVARRVVRRRRMEVKEKERLKRMEKFCRLNPDQAKLDRCARLIQDKLFTRLKLRREAAELRKKLKDLP